MEISWLGHACFRLKGRDSAVIMDPCPRSTGYNIGKQQANIVTISHPHPDHSYVEPFAGTSRLLDAPGEYEVGGVMVTGLRTFHDDKKGAERGRNTTFIVEVDEVRICHLGDIGHVPSSEQLEALNDIDVLLIPVGGHSTVNAATASEIISQLEPKIVVPMHYATDVSTAQLETLEPFIKQMGITAPTAQPKLSLTRGNLPIQTQVMVMEYRK